MRTHGSKLLAFVIAVTMVLLCTETLRAQPCDPSVCGAWGDVTPMKLPPPGQPTGRMKAVHSILLHTGKVLCIDQHRVGNTPHIVLFDPVDESITLVSDSFDINGHNLFCSGHAALADGRIFFSGGGAPAGMFRTTVYTPSTNPPEGTFAAGPDENWCLDKNNCPGSEANTLRWYPTCTTLADGTILVTDGWTHGGSVYGNGEIPVILQPNAGAPSTWTWNPLYDAEYCREMAGDPCPLPIPDQFNLGVYAFMFVLKNAAVFMAGSHHIDPAEALDIPTRSLKAAMESWTEVPLGLPPGFIKGGSVVMYQSDKIMKAGGGLTGDHGDCKADNITNRVFTIDFNQDPPVWVEQQAMNHYRLHFYLIALPDGKILALGGTAGGEVCSPNDSGCDGNNAVLEPELYDPYAQPPDWTVMAPMGQPRQYHSSAVLLPDGSVFIAGGELCGSAGNEEKTYQIYTPPYFHQGPRPTMTSWPPTLGYNAAYSIVTPDAEEITKVRLIRLGAATHSLDQEQRSLELSFTIKTASLLRIVAPQHGFAAPPGFYLLGIAKGANGSLPSKGQIVQVGNVPA